MNELLRRAIETFEWRLSKRKKRVIPFSKGADEDSDVLGVKGAMISEMYREGLPVPVGFVISNEVCRHHIACSNNCPQYSSECGHESNSSAATNLNFGFSSVVALDADVMNDIVAAVRHLEQVTGKSFPTPTATPLLFSPTKAAADARVVIDDRKESNKLLTSGWAVPAPRKTSRRFPLLLSVRPSFAPNIEPRCKSCISSSSTAAAALTSVLYIGMNADVAECIANVTDNTCWALRMYWQFLRSFGTAIMNVDCSLYSNIVRETTEMRKKTKCHRGGSSGENCSIYTNSTTKSTVLDTARMSGTTDFATVVSAASVAAASTTQFHPLNISTCKHSSSSSSSSAASVSFPPPPPPPNPNPQAEGVSCAQFNEEEMRRIIAKAESLSSIPADGFSQLELVASRMYNQWSMFASECTCHRSSNTSSNASSITVVPAVGSLKWSSLPLHDDASPTKPMSETAAAAAGEERGGGAGGQSSHTTSINSTSTGTGSSGLALLVQAMVHSDFNALSGSGMMFTRNPFSGEPLIYGEYAHMQPSEDALDNFSCCCSCLNGSTAPAPAPAPSATAGRTTAHQKDSSCGQCMVTAPAVTVAVVSTLPQMRLKLPVVYSSLQAVATILERKWRKVLSTEFTVEDGVLYMMSCRPCSVGCLSPLANVRVLVDFEQEGLLSRQEAILGIDFDTTAYFTHKVIHPSYDVTIQGAQNVLERLQRQQHHGMVNAENRFPSPPVSQLPLPLSSGLKARSGVEVGAGTGTDSGTEGGTEAGTEAAVCIDPRHVHILPQGLLAPLLCVGEPFPCSLLQTIRSGSNIISSSSSMGPELNAKGTSNTNTIPMTPIPMGNNTVVTGRLAFSFEEVLYFSRNGQLCVLCKQQLTVDDIPALQMANAVVTYRPETGMGGEGDSRRKMLIFLLKHHFPGKPALLIDAPSSLQDQHEPCRNRKAVPSSKMASSLVGKSYSRSREWHCFNRGTAANMRIDTENDCLRSTGMVNTDTTHTSNQKNDEGRIESGMLVCHQGDLVTLDGTTGVLLLGSVPSMYVGKHDKQWNTILSWADTERRAKIYGTVLSAAEAKACCFNPYRSGNSADCADGLAVLDTEALVCNDEHCAGALRSVLLLLVEAEVSAGAEDREEVNVNRALDNFAAELESIFSNIFTQCYDYTDSVTVKLFSLTEVSNCNIFPSFESHLRLLATQLDSNISLSIEKVLTQTTDSTCVTRVEQLKQQQEQQQRPFSSAAAVCVGVAKAAMGAVFEQLVKDDQRCLRHHMTGASNTSPIAFCQGSSRCNCGSSVTLRLLVPVHRSCGVDGDVAHCIAHVCYSLGEQTQALSVRYKALCRLSSIPSVQASVGVLLCTPEACSPASLQAISKISVVKLVCFDIDSLVRSTMDGSVNERNCLLDITVKQSVIQMIDTTIRCLKTQLHHRWDSDPLQWGAYTALFSMDGGLLQALDVLGVQLMYYPVAQIPVVKIAAAQAHILTEQRCPTSLQ